MGSCFPYDEIDPLLLTTKLYCLPEITVRVYWHVGLGEDDERSLKGEWG